MQKERPILLEAKELMKNSYFNYFKVLKLLEESYKDENSTEAGANLLKLYLFGHPHKYGFFNIENLDRAREIIVTFSVNNAEMEDLHTYNLYKYFMNIQALLTNSSLEVINRSTESPMDYLGNQLYSAAYLFNTKRNNSLNRDIEDQIKQLFKTNPSREKLETNLKNKTRSEYISPFSIIDFYEIEKNWSFNCKDNEFKMLVNAATVVASTFTEKDSTLPNIIRNIGNIIRNIGGIKKETEKTDIEYNKTKNKNNIDNYKQKDNRNSDIVILEEISLLSGDTQRALGELYLEGNNGLGVPENRNIGENYLNMAASSGNPEAHQSLGEMHLEHNYTKAKEHFEEAAKRGHGKAFYSLGVMYEEGMGVEKDLERGIKYYEEAGEKGVGAAMNRLGVFYYNKQDITTAIEWFAEGIKVHDYASMLNMALIYSDNILPNTTCNHAATLYLQIIQNLHLLDTNYLLRGLISYSLGYAEEAYMYFSFGGLLGNKPSLFAAGYLWSENKLSIPCNTHLNSSFCAIPFYYLGSLLGDKEASLRLSKLIPQNNPPLLENIHKLGGEANCSECLFNLGLLYSDSDTLSSVSSAIYTFDAIMEGSHNGRFESNSWYPAFIAKWNLKLKYNSPWAIRGIYTGIETAFKWTYQLVSSLLISLT